MYATEASNNQEESESDNIEDLLVSDYDERTWFGESGVPDPARDPITQLLALLKKPQTMGNL
ncbi:unnamed protein product, partial [Thelazia callipaeda]|uniref:Uncharacterized protein n=1 Tax=Thelazia callipaeda TaxID=103827 RepID=A0A0N5CTU8_THECL